MMNETTTIEQMNEAIALFMGYIKQEAGVKYQNRVFLGKDFFTDGNGRFKCYFDSLEYHTSWDWLMEVVEKIETPELDGKCQNILRAGAGVQIFYKACIIHYEPDEESGDNNDETTIHAQGETKLEAAYKAVHQFIQWYNQNNNQ